MRLGTSRILALEVSGACCASATQQETIAPRNKTTTRPSSVRCILRTSPPRDTPAIPQTCETTRRPPLRPVHTSLEYPAHGLSAPRVCRACPSRKARQKYRKLSSILPAPEFLRPSNRTDIPCHSISRDGLAQSLESVCIPASRESAPKIESCGQRAIRFGAAHPAQGSRAES